MKVGYEFGYIRHIIKKDMFSEKASSINSNAPRPTHVSLFAYQLRAFVTIHIGATYLCK